MAITAAEQYLIEMINRARLDPQAEAARYGLSLNAGLQGTTITGAPLDPLSPNTNLEAAAQGHSLWMLAEDVFDHTGVNGSSPGARITDAGYAFTGSWAWRENLAWTGTTSTLNLTSAIEEHHEGLYRSAGHRANTFSDNIKEVGAAQVAGKFTYQGTTYNSSMLTLNFASSGRDVYVTGVAYEDSDGDAFYGIGEGSGGIWISAGGSQATTASAGGYGIGVTANGSLSVTVGEGNASLARLRVDAADGNVKIDVVTDASGSDYLAISSDATLVSGIADARLLGIADIDLNGNAAANNLIGNNGDNELRGYGGNDDLSGGAGADKLYGGNGDDVLQGGTGRDASWGGLDKPKGSDNADELLGEAGNDRLIGQSGYDVLNGGIGDDILTGGGGRDTFIFTSGRDTVTDFADNVDTVKINAGTLGLDLTVDDVIDMGKVVGGNAVFDFGNGNVLTLTGETDIAMLVDDLMIL
jgi:Ca2+-binding RTX toxin-like protein